MSLDVSNLCFSYGTLQVLNNLSFTAPSGKFTVLLGRNGSGKSTLFKALAGLLPVNSGSIKVMGEEMNSLKTRSRARLLGYLPQFHQTVFSFTVEEVVLTGRASYIFSQPSREDRKKANEAIETVGMKHLCGRPYTELSGGERQLVMIARVLAQEPRVILLDEPISHLDLANQQGLLKMLKQITTTGVTVLAILHDPDAAFMYADNLVFLKEGRIASPKGERVPWNAEFIKEVHGITAAILPFRDKAFVMPFEEDGV